MGHANMRRSVGTAGLALMLCLGACGDTGSVDSKTAIEGATNSSANVTRDLTSNAPPTRDPGNWKTEMQIVKLEMPGLPPAAQEAMKQMMIGMSGMEMCLTPEAAEKEDFASELAKGPTSQAQCEFSKKDIRGEAVSVAGTCTGEDGQPLKVALDGTIGARKTDMTIKTSGPTQAGKMELVMRVTGTHTGDCKAGTPTT